MHSFVGAWPDVTHCRIVALAVAWAVWDGFRSDLNGINRIEYHYLQYFNLNSETIMNVIG